MTKVVAALIWKGDKFMICQIAEGEPQKLEHNDIQWITPSEISNYQFCPADEEILEKILMEK